MPEMWLPGEPVAKGRPRMTTVGGSARAYTPAATRKAEEYVAASWRHPMIEAGVPVVVHFNVFHQRPASHYLTGGGLSAAGRRMPLPTKRPDLDNIIKLVLDGLNGVAFHDDAQIIQIHARRWWQLPHSEPGIKVSVAAASDVTVSVG